MNVFVPEYTGREQGVALVLVLWLLALFTIMAGGYTATMRTETLLTAHHVQSAQARALSEAGIWYGIQELLKPESEQTRPLNGNPESLNFGNGGIEIRLYDEAGKIDLNTARVELLQNLLRTAEPEEAAALKLLHAILDWRDRDNLKRNSGAEDDDYAAANRNYGAKDGPFNSVGELRLVLGMTEKVFRQIEPALTVHSHQPSINPEAAPREALLALPGAGAAAIDEFLALREEHAETNTGITGVDARYTSGSSARTVTVSSTGMAADSTFTTEAVILLKRNATEPFSILLWKESVAEKRTGTDEGRLQSGLTTAF